MSMSWYTKAVKSWLKQKIIPLLQPWPGSSPDLNITESVWTVLKQEVSVHNPTSEADLINWMKAVWVREITPEFFIENWPDRCLFAYKLAFKKPKDIIAYTDFQLY